MVRGWSSQCPRCGSTGPLDDGVTGCGSCGDEGIGMPMVPRREPLTDPALPGPPPAGLGAMWRWSAHLPPVGRPVSLGEGGTPFVEVDLSDVPGRLLLKDERANPTGSFKDRLASAVVSRARQLGAETVVAASTGNAGLAVAAYAAAADLRAVVLASGGLPAPTAAALEAFGACVLTTETSTDRWTATRIGVERLGWFPVTNYLLPPVASHPVGVHAYRTIAYEIAEALDWSVPDWVVLPVSRGDGLFGVWAGFAELVELGRTPSVPRMLAVERFPSLSDALARDLEQPEPVTIDGPVQARSISDPQGTAMAVHALRMSGGHAVSADDQEIRASWVRLAARGHLTELSSAAALCGVRSLVATDALTDGSTVVMVCTAGPYAQQTLGEASAQRRVEDPADAVALEAAVAERFTS
ncbi:MAG: pyridoxal-phosphate dependent enzyme [Nocardioidaceae bacterium]